MKKLLLVVTALFLTVFCTGCVKYSYNIEIDKNDKVSISQTEAMNLTFFKQYDPEFEDKFKDSFSNIKEDYEKEGYEVTDYSDETYTGITLTKKDIEFKKAADNLKIGFEKDDDEGFTIEKRGFSKIYKIHLLYNMQKAMEGNSNNDIGSMNSSNSDVISFNNDNDRNIVSQTKQTDPTTGDVIETTTYDDGSTFTSRYNQQEQEKFGKAIGETLGSVPGLTPVIGLTIKSPKKATKNNAAKVISDTEYYWDLTADKQPVEIILEYERFDASSLGPILSVLIIFGLLCFIFYKTKTEMG